MLAKKCVVN